MTTMTGWWESLSGIVQFFYAVGFLSTLVLLVQLLLSLIGLSGHDADMGSADEVAAPGDVGLDHADLAAHSTGLGLISVRTVVAFFVGFGWGGVAMLRTGMPGAAAVVLAFVIGALFTLVVFYLMKSIFRLSDSGNIDYRNAVGQAGTVYTRIPGRTAGTGQIQVCVQGRLRELPAVFEGEEDLPSGTPVQVEKIVGGTTVLVRKLEVK